MHPTGEQIDLVAGATHAVVTEVGAGLRALEVDGRARVEDFDADATPPMGAGMVLVPWPNRIAGARYTWRGQEYALEVTEPARGHAIHGFLRRRPWTVARRAPTTRSPSPPTSTRRGAGRGRCTSRPPTPSTPPG